MLTLCIHGFEADPQTVTDVLEIEPTSVQRRGELSRGKRLLRDNAWFLESHPEITRSEVQHDEALIRIICGIRGRQKQFIRLRAEIKPKKIYIYGGFHVPQDEQCGLWLDHADMLVLAQCQVDWGLDLFVRTAATA